MKKKHDGGNYLDRIPAQCAGIAWRTDKKGIVTLEIENRGAFNRIAQKLFKKPKISYIHLDEVGSVVWNLMDGEKNIYRLGEAVEEAFGEEAYPLYERLAKYFQILESYGFISWK